MQQAVYGGARSLSVRSAEIPRPGPEQVRIDVAFTGICGTDLHIFNGEMDARVRAPTVIGHEMSGRLGALGAGVTGWAVGDPVTVMPLTWCNVCPACLAGHTHICHRLNFIGIDSAGSMQQSWVVPATTLLRLPADLPLRAAALVEPTAVAVHDVRRAGLRSGERALVVGGGPVGVLIAVVARNAGAEVAVVEPAAFRRGVSERLGLVAVDPAAVDVAAWVQDWTAGRGAAVSFEVSGSAAGVATAVAALGTRGRLCLVAIHPKPREIDLHRFFWRELSLIGARLYERADYDEAIALVAAGVVPAATLISKVVPLRAAPEAFAALESGGGVLKVLLDCQPTEERP